MRAFFLTVGQVLHKAPALKTCPFCGRVLAEGPDEGLLACDSCSELGEWFQRNQSFLLSGETGTGKSIWLYTLVDYYLNHSEHPMKCVYVTFDALPSQVRQDAASFIDKLPNLEAESRLLFVDGHSALANVESTEKHRMESVSDFDALHGQLSRLATDGYGAFFLDSLTPLAAVTPPEKLARGLVKLVVGLKKVGGTLFFAASQKFAEAGMIPLPELVDSILEFRASPSYTSGAIRQLGLKTWLRGAAETSKPSRPLLEFHFYKARGRPRYPGWIPFMIGDHSTLLVLPDDSAAIHKMQEDVDFLR